MLTTTRPTNHTPLTPDSTAMMAESLLAAATPRDEWRCGIEWELIGYTADTLRRLNPDEIERVLRCFVAEEGSCVREDGRLIEVVLDGARLTLEPGGQLEYSGAPQSSLVRVHSDAAAFLTRLRDIAERQGCLFLGVGFDPLRTFAEQQWYPKKRYAAMRPAMERAGARGLDMMTRTAAVHCNLDFDTPDDLARKFMLAARLAPIATAIFANSPFDAGQVSGYKSTRALVWLETDDARTGVSPSALNDEFTIESFVGEALDTDLLFVRRGDVYDARVAGISFRKFLHGGAAHLGLTPVYGDWLDHLSTIFTEVRLRPHIEVRSADAGSIALALAAQGFWRGLLYDERALEAAVELAPRLTIEEARELSLQVARDGLAARACGIEVLALAKEFVRLAGQGLRRTFPDEQHCLDPISALVVDVGISSADVLLKNWYGDWGGRIERVVEHLRVA